MARDFPDLAENKFHIYIHDGPSCRMHGHDFLEFAYLARGTIAHTIDGNTEVLHAGDYFIVDYGTKHEYHTVSGEPSSVINVMFYPEFVDRTLACCRSFEDVVNSYLVRFRYRTLKYVPTGKTLHDRNGTILGILEKAMGEYTEKKPGYMAYIRCLLVEMLIGTMREIGKNAETEGASHTVLEIVSYLQSHYGEKLH